VSLLTCRIAGRGRGGTRCVGHAGIPFDAAGFRCGAQQFRSRKPDRHSGVKQAGHAAGNAADTPDDTERLFNRSLEVTECE
jgi:hypothetical protein